MHLQLQRALRRGAFFKRNINSYISKAFFSFSSYFPVFRNSEKFIVSREKDTNKARDLFRKKKKDNTREKRYVIIFIIIDLLPIINHNTIFPE